MASDTEVMDAVSDAIRERVTPLAGPSCGYPVVRAMEARGWRVVRGHHAVVDSSWLAEVMIELNRPVRADDTLAQRAAMGDRLRAKLLAGNRGAI